MTETSYKGKYLIWRFQIKMVVEECRHDIGAVAENFHVESTFTSQRERANWKGYGLLQTQSLLPVT